MRIQLAYESFLLFAVDSLIDSCHEPGISFCAKVLILAGSNTRSKIQEKDCFANVQ